MRAHPLTWTLRLIWLTLPFTVGDAIAAATTGRSDAVRVVASTGAWVVWAIVLVALVVPRPMTLTIVRFAVPTSLVAAAWALLATTEGDVEALGIVGLVSAAIASLLATSAWVADDFVDGASYGDERRFSLRAPGALVVGPIPLVWAAGVAGLAIGPMLAASGDGSGRLVGVVVGLAGLAVTAWSLRSLHVLSRRAAVFVPAGLTLVDELALGESTLMARSAMVRLGPAAADTDATDLSQRALGLALEVGLEAPVGLLIRDGARSAHEMSTARIVFTPARPASLLREAAARGFPVETPTS